MSIFAGDTSYKNFSRKEINKKLSSLYTHSEHIIKVNKKDLATYDIQLDLMTVFADIISLAEKLTENKHTDLFQTKIGKPSYQFCKKLKDMGNEAENLNKTIGHIWWGDNNYGAKYDDLSLEAKNYKQLRDYIVSMIELRAIGQELENRYFENDKPLYKDINLWNIFLDIYERTLKAIFK